MADAPDFQHNKQVALVNKKPQNNQMLQKITLSNLIPSCIYLAVRHAIDATWLNDRDQFLYPNDKWIKDAEFQNDCLAFTLFHSQNRISSKAQNSSNFTSNTPPHPTGCEAKTPPARGGALNKANQKSPSLAEGDLGGGCINHFIPFNESEVNAKEAFKSGFMYEFINGKLGKSGSVSSLRASEASVAIHKKGVNSKVDCHENPSGFSRNDGVVRDCHEVVPTSRNDGVLFDEKDLDTKNFIPQKPLKFSKEARAVFDAGREIWLYYHTNARENDYNANASLYDIKEYFQGRKKDEKGNETGRMNATSTDERYNELMANLRLTLKQLAEKITPKIYEYGFLRK